MKKVKGRKESKVVRNKGLLATVLLILIPVYVFTSLFALQFLCLLFLFIVIGSRLYTEHLVRSIKIIRRDIELREFRQQWARIELIVENRGFLPVFLLAIRDGTGMLPLSKGNKALYSLPARSRNVFEWRGYCSDRGVFILGPTTVQGADPLGLFPFQFTFSEQTKLFVYPTPRSVPLLFRDGIPLGRLLSQNILHEDLSRPRSLRPYRMGDEQRRINWKASVRSQKHLGINLMVNEYEATVSFPMSVFLNLDIDAYPTKKALNYIERVIEVGAALCLLFAQKQQDMGLVVFSHRKTFIINPSRFALIPILETLALFESVERIGEKGDCAGVLLERMKQFSPGAKIFYVGPILTNDDYIRLNVLKKFHLNIEYFIIDEKTVPLFGYGGARQYQIKEYGNDIL
ncbi:MAG: DUF58 domain-containing protein [Treponema sp.]|jgi:uncharacterized protein (DUF58 family)|nr:DUF58 domain-containing protein [Treponema sp.]